MPERAGAGLWQALENETPLQIVGTINAYAVLLAEKPASPPFIYPEQVWRITPLACLILP